MSRWWNTSRTDASLRRMDEMDIITNLLIAAVAQSGGTMDIDLDDPDIRGKVVFIEPIEEGKRRLTVMPTEEAMARSVSENGDG